VRRYESEKEVIHVVGVDRSLTTLDKMSHLEGGCDEEDGKDFVD